MTTKSYVYYKDNTIYKKKTYKQLLLRRVQSTINIYEKMSVHSSNFHLNEAELRYKNLADKLRLLRTVIENTHGIHFVPKRFPSAKYLAIKLLLDYFGITL